MLARSRAYYQAIAIGKAGKGLFSVTNFKNTASGQEGAHIALVNGSIVLALIGLAIFLIGSGLQKIMRREET